MNAINLNENEPVLAESNNGKFRLPAALLPGHYLWKRSRLLLYHRSEEFDRSIVTPDTEFFWKDELGFLKRIVSYEGLADGIYTMTAGVYPNVVDAAKFKVENGEITLLEAKPNLEAL